MNVISYKPLAGEIDCENFLPVTDIEKILVVPTEKDTDPFEWAAKCMNLYPDSKVHIFVPGTRFDLHGTRHGRGGGWYDRFLSRLPKEWIRIGVTKSTALSPKPLQRQSWDQPMDWLLIQNKNTWSVFKTNARKI